MLYNLSTNMFQITYVQVIVKGVRPWVHSEGKSVKECSNAEAIGLRHTPRVMASSPAVYNSYS